MAEEIQMSEEVVIEAEPVRPLPVRAQSRTIELWGREVGPLAVAAAGGAAAGVVVVAVARAARAPRRPPRRGLFRRREKVVASRSFLVDVHVLGR
ncbi:MAG TPA: hypothetical protein VFY30_07380 [Solirubrobacterales bacterium]|nr:hypothetical protein [Solirubrobacterales bacterium]